MQAIATHRAFMQVSFSTLIHATARTFSHPSIAHLRHVREYSQDAGDVWMLVDLRSHRDHNHLHGAALRDDRFNVLLTVALCTHHNAFAAGNIAAPGVHICADGDPPGYHWIAYYYTTLLVTESVLLSLSLYKGWHSWRSDLKHSSSIQHVLTRDSVLYFLA